MVIVACHHGFSQFPVVAQADSIPEHPVERSVPWFDDPQPLLLQDTLITQCWSRGWPLIFYRVDIGVDLRAVDSCSCWRVRGSLHQDILGGGIRTEVKDSSLVAKWRREVDGIMSCRYRDGQGIRSFRFEEQDTLKTETLFQEGHDGMGFRELRTIWFRAREVP